MKQTSPNILLVNPWIHDFAAYDVWAKPLGLLYIASILRHHGFNISYIDCLNRFHPLAPVTDPGARHGRGPYIKTEIPKPKGLEDVPRAYSRYGIPPEWFLDDLAAIPRPDLIIVTSLMTYWYPGVSETIKLIKEKYPDVLVLLGGIYATLCREHAQQNSGADRVITGPAEDIILKLAEDHTGFAVKKNFSPDDTDKWPYPAFDLQHAISYIPLLTSRGCPYVCAYCASGFLNKKRDRRSPESIITEIKYWHKNFMVKDFAFYDDALLVEGSQHIIPMLEEIIASGMDICFHTPNALHIREITGKIAALMFKAGFKTVRLGLETAAFDKRSEIDSKVTIDEFKRAVTYLLESGFDRKQLGAYILAGLPGQSIESIEKSITIVKKSGITPVPAYYTPIPHTAMWKKAVSSSRYNLVDDPVFTNNAIFPCQHDPFSWETISRLKQLCATE